jgi:hypothetical protein
LTALLRQLPREIFDPVTRYEEIKA